MINYKQLKNIRELVRHFGAMSPMSRGFHSKKGNPLSTVLVQLVLDEQPLLNAFFLILLVSFYL